MHSFQGGKELAKLDTEGFTLLHRAAEAGNTQLVAQLLSLKADLEVKDATWQNTPLFRAVLADKPAVVQQLLDAKAAVDSVNKHDVSSLYQASAVGSLKVIEILLKASANVNHKTSGRQTPLHAACLNGRVAAVKILLAHKANPSAVTQSGVCPLYMAAEHGHVEIIKVLLNSGGADVNQTSVDGVSPLMRAAFKNQFPAIRTLVDFGARLDLISMDKTAAMWAKQEGHMDVFRFLQSRESLAELSQLLQSLELKDILAKVRMKEAAVHVPPLQTMEKSDVDQLAGALGLNLGERVLFQRAIETHRRQSHSAEVVYEDSDVSVPLFISSNTSMIHRDRLLDCCARGELLAQTIQPLDHGNEYSTGMHLTRVHAFEGHCKQQRLALESTVQQDYTPTYNPGEAGPIPIIVNGVLEIPPTSTAEGSQASVFVVLWHPPKASRSRQFALKQPHKNSNNKSEALKFMEQEANLWKGIPPHPNVASMAAIVREPDGNFQGMLMEYHPLGSLDRLKLFRLHPDDLIQSLRGLARGLMHLHSIGVVHRDIATRNVLVSTDKAFILADFGMSRFGESVPLQGDEKLPWRALAPEILAARRLWAQHRRIPLGISFSPSTDMWAFGVLIWEIANAKEAYTEHGNNIPFIQQGIESGEISLPLQSTCLSYPLLAPVLLGCLQRDPQHRINAREVLVLLGEDMKKIDVQHREYSSSHHSNRDLQEEDGGSRGGDGGERRDSSKNSGNGGSRRGKNSSGGRSRNRKQ